MSSVFFDPGREGFAMGEIVWKTGGSTIKQALVRGYTFNAAHKFVSDITGAGGTLVSTSPALTSLSATSGVLDAADITHAAVPAGAAIPVSIYFQSSAVTGGADVAATAQRLICYVDTGTGLPVTPNGQAINWVHDNGSNKIAKL